MAAPVLWEHEVGVRFPAPGLGQLHGWVLRQPAFEH